MRVALRSNDNPGVRGGLLEEGKEHGGLLIFGERLVLAVLYHAHNFRSFAAPELEMPTDCFVDGSENLAGKFAIHHGDQREPYRHHAW